MKYLYYTLFLILTFTSCQKETKEVSSVNPINWEKRSVQLKETDSLIKGSSYLSVYSEIYSITEHRTINLTVTVSLRNVSSTDPIYISKADYYNTKGNLIRSYFDKPIYIKPLETIEIVIDEKDSHGGSGANFIFDWATQKNSQNPIFEAVMISTSGQQGISFTSQGLKL